MLLIDTRDPPPPPAPERARWEPNRRLWGWVALAVAAFVAADSVGGFASYVLICATLVFVCRAVCVVLPPLDGLREHRQ
jgi:hypothetical protein